MSIQKEKALKITGIIFFFIILLALPSVAHLSIAENVNSDRVGAYFVWVMFPSWVYLGGAIIMLSLGLKYMAGGALSKPFVLMGTALLVDALVQIVSSLAIIGLMPEVRFLSEVVFGVGLLFRLSVVFSMVWIGSIFGVLARKPVQSSTPTTPPTQSTPGV